MNVETILISRIGDVGKRLHTGRSRNDQVALDIRMYTKKEIIAMKELVKNLMVTLNDFAANHTETILPGYTHLQRAQPVTLAHHLLAYVEMFKRDYDRLCDTYKRTDVMPWAVAHLPPPPTFGQICRCGGIGLCRNHHEQHGRRFRQRFLH
mgnify:CR=1 FL=1